jgi:hypothetical protein
MRYVSSSYRLKLRLEECVLRILQLHPKIGNDCFLGFQLVMVSRKHGYTILFVGMVVFSKLHFRNI